MSFILRTLSWRINDDDDDDDTDACAAHGDDDERLKPASFADDPDETNKQQHSEDVLDAREVDSKHRP